MPKNNFFHALRATPAPERALCGFTKPASGNIDSPFAHQFFLLALGIVWIRITSWTCMRFLTGSSTISTCPCGRSHTGQLLWCCRGFVSGRCFQPFHIFGPIPHCNYSICLGEQASLKRLPSIARFAFRNRARDAAMTRIVASQKLKLQGNLDP